MTKYINSEVLDEDLKYQINGDNFRLRFRLLEEQKNFCAYTEKYITKIDSVDVEHFDPSKKGNDDYYNYYTTLRYVNEQKISKYSLYKNSTFFNSLFFQTEKEFNARIKYEDFTYNAISDADQDAKDLIDYLGFNDDYLYDERMNHIKRLRSTLDTFTDNQKIEYFRQNKRDLSFITAIEFEFQIDLSEILNH